MTDDVIEKVARAIADVQTEDSSQCADDWLLPARDSDVMPQCESITQAALAALEAGDGLGNGLLVGREEWREVVKAAENEGRRAAEAMRERCADIVEREVGDIEAMPGPASIIAEKIRKLEI